VAEAIGNPTSGVQSIPTSYRGVSFRSRLEATWAYNLDAWGISWSYEPEGFTLPSGARYLPDFWLPDIRTWLEVKGPGVGGLEKTEWFRLLVMYKPECRRHTIHANPDRKFGTCQACGPREHCRHWQGHFDCCAADFGPSYEIVVTGFVPVASRADFRGATLIACRKCKRTYFEDGRVSWGCRYTDCGAGNERPSRGVPASHDCKDPLSMCNRECKEVAWKQMQWMPNGGAR
jgi:hypothetical protein